MNLEDYAEGNQLFKSYFKKNKESLLKLVTSGQSPKALFIGCSDSRVIPDLMVQSDPGDLFVIRNVGNFVPPYKPDEDFHATASGIEYAVSILKVKEVIICGHTHCGACSSLYEEIDDPSLIHTKKWLELGKSAKTSAILSLGVNAPKEELLRLTEKLSIMKQIDNLLTYPIIKARFEAGTLSIHGWYYDIETGNIDYYNAETCEFLPLKDLVQTSDNL
ncbi:carbonic anhydrase [Sulfurimonas gotlandica GD1]|jgi:carbonic anhydrase|uniref:Carbonic anhydrase n=1 Tax=Sulfurimonas gotlandica (strain DSM 19862 / JCM 16533 / GD1) TaxID=929558 RepID=B6BLP4_SULGG|nr:carbonic anhydrase [Sulfurimonas gotlandica]EDZ62031.1 carbonate dehydratase [Sulfurimonas gotlandica GD1]EHP28702.1 carbonic anhydrase [Sulfurimonas gotlandica GD1]